MAHIRIQPELGLRIDINQELSRVRWYGTRTQLESEGVIPIGADWPANTRDWTRFHINHCWFSLHLVAGQDAPPESDRLYRLDHHSNSREDWRLRRATLKIEEAGEIMSVGSAEWSRRFKLWCAANSDQQFQGFKRVLLGQKRRGRKTKGGGDVTADTNV